MGKTFAVSDLHGMIEIYYQIKEMLQPEDHIYCLGDMGDRGTNCWETIKVIMDDPQFEVIKGNHEDMLVNLMKVALSIPEDEKEIVWYCREGELVSWNGGIETFNGWMKESLTERSKWYRKLKELPTHLEYINKNGKKIYMSHAGWTPYNYDDIPVDEDLIWDRSHYMCEWPHEAPEDIIVVHGHTPIEYLDDDRHIFHRNPYTRPTFPLAYWYADHHKCCIDNGVFYTQCTVMLDLDTFEEHKFYTKSYDPNAIWD